MWQFGILVALISGPMLLGLRRVFRRVGYWLPVCVTVILPPLLFVPYGIFRQLVEIGRAREATGRAPENAMDDFANTINTKLTEAVLWVVISLLVAFALARWSRRQGAGN